MIKERVLEIVQYWYVDTLSANQDIFIFLVRFFNFCFCSRNFFDLAAFTFLALAFSEITFLGELARSPSEVIILLGELALANILLGELALAAISGVFLGELALVIDSNVVFFGELTRLITRFSFTVIIRFRDSLKLFGNFLSDGSLN